MGEALFNGIQNGLDSNKIHPLGGQMSGYIGRKIIELSNGRAILSR